MVYMTIGLVFYSNTGRQLKTTSLGLMACNTCKDISKRYVNTVKEDGTHDMPHAPMKLIPYSFCHVR